jgi:hypothetical protein
MHYWGDDWEHWDDLRDAEEYISKEMDKKGYSLSSKEKYGSIRYEGMYDRKSKFHYPPLSEGWKVLYEVVKEAIDEYPQLEDELLEDIASWEELVGQEVHDKYWTTL